VLNIIKDSLENWDKRTKHKMENLDRAEKILENLRVEYKKTGDKINVKKVKDQGHIQGIKNNKKNETER